MCKWCLLFSFCLCGLETPAQTKTLYYAIETWDGAPSVKTEIPGTITLHEASQKIIIKSRYRNETYRINRKVQQEDSVALYSCEIRFRSGELVKYVIRYDPAHSLFVLYPYSQYLSVSTTFWLKPL